jgi:hypothetical protein
MPSRWFSVVIVLGWLATTSWLVYTEFLPLLLPGTPPAFAIDLVEEVRLQPLVSRWVALRHAKGKTERVFLVQLSVERLEDDDFEMGAKYTPHTIGRKKNAPASINGVVIRRYESTYRVNSAGDLLGVHMSIAGEVTQVLPFSADITGKVRQGKMALKINYSFLGSQDSFTSEAFDVPRGGSMLMPLHPVNRVSGLRLGKQWTMAQINPMDLIRSALDKKIKVPDFLFGKPGPKYLHATVRNQFESFTNEGRESGPCFVVDCRDLDEAEKNLTTWVEVKTGRVIRQEVWLHGEHWELVRE